MKVQDMLDAKGAGVSTIDSSATVGSVVERLKQEGIGAMVVSEGASECAGIVSERDVVRGLATHGEKLLEMAVSDLMTRDVKTCTPDSEITEIMSIMTKGRFRHLPVESDGKLAGIISIGDVVKHRLEELEEETHVLRDYIVGRA